jgi:hypothetical protein
VVGCTIDKHSGTAIVCSKESKVWIRSSVVVGSAIDARDQSQLHFDKNQFADVSIIVWGSASVVLEGDHFRGQADAAVAASGGAVATLQDVTVERLSGAGVVGYGGARLTVTNGKFVKCQNSAIQIHSGAALAATDVSISDCGDAGVIIADAGDVSFRGLAIVDGRKCGGEIRGTPRFQFTDCKFERNETCGLAVIGSGGELSKCTFAGNKFSGLHVSGSSVSVSGSEFLSNVAGGVKVVEGGKVTLSQTSFTKNSWAAVSVGVSGTADVSDCPFEANGIAVESSGGARVRNATFKNHHSAAILATAGELSLEKCDVTDELIGLSVGGTASLQATTLTFRENQAHVQASGGSIVVEASTFRLSKSQCGVHVKQAVATFKNCQFEDDSQVAIVSEGETNVQASKVERAGKMAMVFDQGASGTIQRTVFQNNGECAFQVIAGEPIIQENTVANHSRFGAYISKAARPVFEGNKFENNGTANVWRAHS